MEDYRSVFESILWLNIRAGFKGKLVCCDNKFKPLLEPIKTEHGFETNYAAAGEHKPHLEQNNCTIQKCVRSLYQGCLYKHLPRLVLQRRVETTTVKLNYFPNKNECFLHYSLREIMMHHLQETTQGGTTGVCFSSQ